MIDIRTNISKLPSSVGVYFFYDNKDTLIYVGKSINIQKRVQQHFFGKDRKSLKIQLFTKRIAYEVMGNELMALLYESELIKQHQPLYNRAQRKTIYQYAMYKEMIMGYESIRINRINEDKEAISSFSTLKEAKDVLFRITENYKLCQKINGLYKTSSSCFQYQIKECYGACLQLQSPHTYNQRVHLFLKKSTLEKADCLIELKGREENEVGIVFIENGIYKGLGFCSKHIVEKSKCIIPRQDNKDVRRILINYMMKQMV